MSNHDAPASSVWCLAPDPAGTGHRRVSSSGDLLVVGAYPTSGSSFDQARPDEIDLHQARRNIANVGRPAQDPVYGKDGPLTRLWADR